ncbi:inosine/guanosine kinase [Pseudoalteromonas sp. SSMSWG5]|jgi:inosine kinase|uniref:inosine/guanosine kinase n=1 Tax=Pseudoalteromonas TaxID=53246 RepID=UPI000ECBAB34|nr:MULTISPECIES: inosine/guanosine kinase [unclassified Pseudoalteromonas]HCV02274.1 inosine/guanosine kinase [Pseudoalteromonas sp.]MCF2901780.1 inosine/guanosine kinase [Pseudoalteromonas sp. OFAV1]MCF2921741.1 inosine/guanosine kinase [Pseudoalteromonas sp. APAL1]MCO7248979.1 inosine/guanosine kinase [Pseudoalteromonas sp. Ps84H-4]TGV21542.1 inosine/guanosine kinase [Pseudoalteromonas sp. MEBiC 03607]|tara:strand:+ start:204 stop:1508 length:1305 start_codon:yes stop_codon:yes gene_type:complete
MKFPGRRRHKHYFPVEAKDPLTNQLNSTERLQRSYITGIDQIVVDIEAKVDQAFLDEFQLRRGMSQVIDSDITNALYDRLKLDNMIDYEFAGGTVGNTMHNYSTLADDRSVLLGVMSENIKIGSYAYRFLCNTSSRVDLDYLQPVDGPIGRCFTLIDETGERTFAISAGLMNHLRPESIDQELIENSSALVISAYLMRTQGDETMTEATMQAVKYANDAGVPVVLTLGTKFLIEQDPTWWADFVKEHVDILAMNEEEGLAITGFEDPLLAADKALDWTDLVICTAGEKGLFMAGYVDDSFKRETEYPLLPGAIADFNRYEFSRAMRKDDCQNPIRAYSHTAPFMGGPDSIKNTNGAGDCALAAVLHDLSANVYHKLNVANSAKHQQPAMTYSSLAQISKYANRASYEVLVQHSPRLSRGLPEREDCLEQVYWDQ